jgi:hypothetical protein
VKCNSLNLDKRGIGIPKANLHAVKCGEKQACIVHQHTKHAIMQEQLKLITPVIAKQAPT